MMQPHARPEDRSRSGIDSAYALPWADPHPGCFRSEGFAEDLHDEAAPTRSPMAARWLRRPNGALPLLGVAVAGVLGAFSR